LTQPLIAPAAPAVALFVKQKWRWRLALADGVELPRRQPDNGEA
jgi:hypothetical protein